MNETIRNINGKLKAKEFFFEKTNMTVKNVDT